MFELLRKGSRAYHEYPGSDQFYDDMRKRMDEVQWAAPHAITQTTAATVREFLNRWASHFLATEEQLADALRHAGRGLALFHWETIVSVDFSIPRGGWPSTSALIADEFDAIRLCNPARNQSTAASKVLHMINPQIFVMWDAAICKGHGVHHREGRQYAYEFLPKMQRFAREAIRQCVLVERCPHEEAIARICTCGHTMAKVLDEYNYACYTQGLKDLILQYPV